MPNLLGEIVVKIVVIGLMRSAWSLCEYMRKCYGNYGNALGGMDEL